MKKVLLLLMALVLPMVASAPLQADEYEYLWLYSPAPSEPQSYAIADLRKITFGEEALQVHLKSQPTPVTWAYANLYKMSLEAVPTTAVKRVAKASDLTVIQSSSELRVESPTPLKSVAIYNLQGRRLALFGQSETSTTYSLKSLPAGVYIVRAENATQTQATKFVKH